MPQRMRAGCGIKFCDRDVLFQHSSDASGGELVAKPIHKDGGFPTECLTRLAPFSLGGVGIDRFDRERAERANPFLASLSPHPNDLLIAINVRILKSDEFTDSQTRGVDRFQDRTVTQPVRLVRRRARSRVVRPLHRSGLVVASAGDAGS